MIFFDEKLHKYTNKEKEQYISCTQLIHKYTNTFDESFWSLYKVLQDKLGFKNDEIDKKRYAKYLIQSFGFSFKNKKVEELYSIGQKLNIFDLSTDYKKEEWRIENKKATDRGTKYHLEQEQKAYLIGKKKTESGDFIYYNKFEDSLENSNFGCEKIECYPELRLYNHKYKLAGTSDVPIFYKDKTFKIEDFKSNKVLKFDNKYDKMLYPLNHLPDCNVSHYTIQLSLYGWMLEQFGYKCKELGLIHVLFDENNNAIAEKYIEVEYRKKDIENLLNDYERNHSQSA